MRGSLESFAEAGERLTIFVFSRENVSEKSSCLLGNLLVQSRPRQFMLPIYCSIFCYVVQKKLPLHMSPLSGRLAAESGSDLLLAVGVGLPLPLTPHSEFCMPS